MLDTLRNLPESLGTQRRLSVTERQAAAERRRLLQQARKQASALVTQAEAEAEQVRSHAMAEGFSHGVLQAAGAIAQVMLLKDGLAARLHDEVCASIQALLREALLSEEWIHSLLQRWQGEHAPSRQAALQVVVPRGTPLPALRQRLATHWAGQLTLEQHEQQRIVLRHGEQVLEFDLPGVIGPLTQQLATRLKGLTPAQRQLDSTCVGYLQTWIETVKGQVPAELEEDNRDD